jgi:hypothetical protein
MGPLEFFQHTGKWSNGEAFLPLADGVLAEAKGRTPYLVYASAAVGLMASMRQRRLVPSGAEAGGLRFL